MSQRIWCSALFATEDCRSSAAQKNKRLHTNPQGNLNLCVHSWELSHKSIKFQGQLAAPQDQNPELLQCPNPKQLWHVGTPV